MFLWWENHDWNFHEYEGKGIRGNEEMLGRCGVKERNSKGLMEVYFMKRIETAVVSMYFEKKEEHEVTNKGGGRCTQVDSMQKMPFEINRRLHGCVRGQSNGVASISSVQHDFRNQDVEVSESRGKD